MSEQLTLADIVGVYGVKGWVKLRPYLENPETLTQIEPLVLEPGPRMRREPGRGIKVDAIKPHGKGVVARLAGIEDRTAAEALKGWVLTTDAESLPDAGPGEYYWRDLVGLRVWCRENGREALLGEVSHLLDTGANDVLVIRPVDGSVDDREHLVPWIPGQVIDRVDLDAGEVWVDWYVDS